MPVKYVRMYVIKQGTVSTKYVLQNTSYPKLKLCSLKLTRFLFSLGKKNIVK
jgi:hypothetical protein